MQQGFSRSVAVAAAAAASILVLSGCFASPTPVDAPVAAPSVSIAPPPTISPVAPSPPPTSEEPIAATPAEVVAESWLATAGPLQSVACAPASTVDLGSLDGVRAYYESVLPCLQDAWLQAHPDLTPALLEVFSGPAPAHSCGAGLESSFYCEGNGTIYMFADEMIIPWNDYAGDDFSHGLTRLSATWVLAHEFGHHIQNVVGVFQVLDDDWHGTEEERRLELQASCLADVFLSSQADAYPVAADYWELQELWRFITRVPNHGSIENQQLWTDRGFAEADPGACDTFAAPAAEVT